MASITPLQIRTKSTRCLLQEQAAYSGHLRRLRSEETEFGVVIVFLFDYGVGLSASEFGMRCLVSLQKVSKMSAVELSYERNNLACCWFKIALLR